jgi:hypothetical protein
MHNLSRRTLLRGTAAAVPATLLAGCGLSIGGTSGATILATVQTDARNLVAGLTGALPALQAVISASTYATVAADLQKAGLYVDQLANLSNLTAAQSPVLFIANAISDALTVATKIPLPANITVILTAAQVLLPIIESAVGLSSAPAPSALQSMMSADEARAILKKAAAGKI